MEESFKQLMTDLIEPQRWAEFLKKFIEVLRINIFIVDHQGGVLIPPCTDGSAGKYGSQFLTTSFRFNFLNNEINLLEGFRPFGEYYEFRDPFDLRVFAVPVRVDENRTIAHMMVGPLVLNRRWNNNEDYLNVAGELKILSEELIDAIQSIRVVSFVTVKAILDLLSEVVKDMVELRLEKRKLSRQGQPSDDIISKRLVDAAEDLYATIHLDELLITVLDVALNLTGAECGSIMLWDENKKDLILKVSRGLEENQIRNIKTDLGNSIAGCAVASREHFFISSRTSADHRIRHLLKRPEIHESLIVPLVAKDKVFGVLNIHTKSSHSKIKSNETNIKHITSLVSTVIGSL